MFSAAYRRYVLVALTSIYTVNMVDRGLAGLLLQPMKQDLQLSDTQVGFMMGMAFAIFYGIIGLPIGRLADSGNRVTIASLSMALWSAANMMFLFVGSYAQLLVIRIFSAIGDAGAKPLTYSLLGDYFPENRERTRAMYVWHLAAPISAIIAWAGGGWLAEQVGWRMAFFWAGLLGLPLALAFQLTVTEPRTRASPHPAASKPPTPPLWATFLTLWRNRSCRHITLALVLMYTVGIGEGTWQAAFLIRHYGIGLGQLGTWVALIGGLGGLISVLAGSYVVDRWFADDENGQMWLSAAAQMVRLPLFIGFLFAGTVEFSLMMMAAQSLLLSAFIVSPYVMLQRLVPDRMRATSLMVVMFFVYLVGQGMGPLIVGSLSDQLLPWVGDESLRYAMLALSFGYLLSGYFFARAAGSIRADLAVADGQPDNG